MTHVELERFLFITGPMDAHANAFLAWLAAGQGGTIVSAGHAVQQRTRVTQLTTGHSEKVAFKNPAVPGKDLAYSELKSPENGLTIAPEILMEERLYITGYHHQKPFVIPVKAHEVRGGKLLVRPDTLGLAQPGMSGSAIVNEQRQVVGVLTKRGPSAYLLEAELLRDVR